MLKFIHDVLGQHLKEDRWEILSSDTDSVCMSLATLDIDNCVKENIKSSWEATKYRYFADNRTEDAYKKTANLPLLFK